MDEATGDSLADDPGVFGGVFVLRTRGKVAFSTHDWSFEAPECVFID